MLGNVHFGSKADILRHESHVRFIPESDIRQCKTSVSIADTQPNQSVRVSWCSSAIRSKDSAGLLIR
jgi:hypothetical protein